MNNWVAIKAELFAHPTLKEATLKQAWRWTAGARGRLDAEATDVRTLSSGDTKRLVEGVPWPVSDPDKRTWALNLVVDAARAVLPPRASRPATAAARLDAVPARSPLGKAIAKVLSQATTPHDRRSWPTCLGTFLLWCDARGVDVQDVWPGDIDAFRRDYLASGRTSPGEYVRMANRLLKSLCQNAEGQKMARRADTARSNCRAAPQR
jgi:hypothetical protein